MPEKKFIWTNEKIISAAKIICGFKELNHVTKIKLLAKIVEMDLQNQAIIRELYFAKPDHIFFVKWTKEEKEYFDKMKPPPAERKSLWKSIFQAVRRSSKI